MELQTKRVLATGLKIRKLFNFSYFLFKRWREKSDDIFVFLRKNLLISLCFKFTMQSRMT